MGKSSMSSSKSANSKSGTKAHSSQSDDALTGYIATAQVNPFSHLPPV